MGEGGGAVGLPCRVWRLPRSGNYECEVSAQGPDQIKKRLGREEGNEEKPEWKRISIWQKMRRIRSRAEA